jgi:hypothetical protein
MRLAVEQRMNGFGWTIPLNRCSAAFAFWVALTGTHAIADEISLDPATMPQVGTVDERFQSYNIEMVEVTGGPFWKPYAAQTNSAELFSERKPKDLGNTRLRRLATALSPAFVRISGTSANTTAFADSDDAPSMAPVGFKTVLTRRQWQGVVDFSRAVDAPVVTSFAASAGARDARGIWTSEQARRLLAATRSMGGRVAAAELVNEPDLPAAVGASSGADLTFAPHPPPVPYANVKSKAPLDQIICSGPLMPTFAKVPAENGSECWHRTTSGADLTFAPHPPPVPHANVKSKAPPDQIICSGPLMPTFANVPAEKGSECWHRTTSGYDAAAYGRDFAVFSAFMKREASGVLILGPGTGSSSSSAAEAFAAAAPGVDAVSYHHYGALSKRCGGELTPDTALSEAWLSRTDEAFALYRTLRDRFASGKPIWLTETADAACGGNPSAATFLDTFRYLDQLGRLARAGAQIVMHNTLAGSDYGLLDEETYVPRPNYWGALLWRQLMGTIVLESGVPIQTGLHAYAHCERQVSGGVTLLLINNDRNAARALVLAKTSERYTLDAATLQDVTVRLNGYTLLLDEAGELPRLSGVRTAAGPLILAPATITFLAIPGAGNSACR